MKSSLRLLWAVCIFNFTVDFIVDERHSSDIRRLEDDLKTVTKALIEELKREAERL